MCYDMLEATNPCKVIMFVILIILEYKKKGLKLKCRPES